MKSTYLSHLAAALVGVLLGCSQGPQKARSSIDGDQDYRPNHEQPAQSNERSPTTHDSKPMETNPPTEGPVEQPVVKGEFNSLSPAEAKVILHKGTDYPGDGGYTLTMDPGSYVCRQCNALLYRAEDKFESHCGWPSFDDEVDGAVTSLPDADGRRVEIVCSNCDGHLGHVFKGERMTAKNTRHCVNSTSMIFVPQGQPLPAKIEKP